MDLMARSGNQPPRQEQPNSSFMWSHRAIGAALLKLVVPSSTLHLAGSVSVRMKVVSCQTCPKWHADFVPARLLVTYVGPGTQFMPDGWVAVPAAVAAGSERVGVSAAAAAHVYQNCPCLG